MLANLEPEQKIQKIDSFLYDTNKHHCNEMMAIITYVIKSPFS